MFKKNTKEILLSFIFVKNDLFNLKIALLICEVITHQQKLIYWWIYMTTPIYIIRSPFLLTCLILSKNMFQYCRFQSHKVIKTDDEKSIQRELKDKLQKWL